MNIELNGHSVFVGQGSQSWQNDQPTLVLLHGAGMDRTVWVLLARYFSRHGYNVVAPDLPGHGSSTGAALTSIEMQAEFLWQVLDQLQHTHQLPDSTVILGGHSMGSLIAVEAAGQRPERVAHVLMFGSGYPMPVAQPLLDAALANDQSAVDMIALYSHCHQSQIGHNPIAGIRVQNSAMALLERAGPGVLHADLYACNAYKGLERAAVAYGKGKATLIVGDSDKMTPIRMSRQLIDHLGADLRVLDQCGHMVMSEQPEQTLQAMRQALG